jgi:hypothetical protein
MPDEGDGDMKHIRLLCLPWLVLFLSGCLTSTPFQSARVVDPGQQSASLSLQRSHDTEDDNEYGWYMLEFSSRVPVYAGRIDFGLNGAIMAMEDEDGLGGVGGMLGLGPKFEIIQDLLAVDVPARFIFAGEATLETTHFYPRAILSLPVTELVEINLSHTRYFFVEDVAVKPYAFSAGLAIGRRGGNIFRPEIGVLVFPEGHQVIQFGLGFTPTTPAPVAAGDRETKTPR